MNSQLSRFARTVFGCGMFVVAGASIARAQGQVVLSAQASEQMQHMAHDLDALAQHAADQSGHQDVWSYGNDSGFSQAVTRLAVRTDRFHERMDTYRAQPWQVGDELRGLLRDARAVQNRAVHARNVDEHTVADWNRAAGLLNRMIQLYNADVRRRPLDGYDGYGYDYPRDGRTPQSRRPFTDPGGNPPLTDEDEQIGALAHDLSDRLDRIYESAAGYSTGDNRQRMTLDTLLHFRDQARAFHARVEQGLTGQTLVSNANHLAQDARYADEEVRQANSQLILGEWREVMRLVDQIQSVAR